MTETAAPAAAGTPAPTAAGTPAPTATPAGVPGARLPQVRRLVTELPGPRSAELATRRAAAVSAGVSSTLPVYAVDADGGVIVDVDGNSLIDLGSGIAVTSVGNAAPAVAAAVTEQVGHLTHTCFMVTPYAGYVEVCEQLNGRTPGTQAKRSALFNSGAEAVENAVKIARLATGRSAVVVFDHAYHGRTNLTMALTAKAMPYKKGFGPFAGEVYRVPMSYPLRDGGLDGKSAAARAISTITTQVGADQVAAVLIEPIQGEGGFVVPADGFLPTLAEWCAVSGALFIADEIQSGFCRTGDWFASEHDGIVPDLVTTAKGMAGGLPLAGVTGRAEIMDAIHPGGLGGTYGGNPVACAAALGAIQTMAELDLCGAARRIESLAVPRLRALAERTGRIAEVRGRGAMLAIEFTVRHSLEPDPAAAAAVARTCHAAGVVVLTCGTYGNVIRLLPPLVIGDDLLDEGLSVLEEAVAALG
jgi:4-aminobutyrate aminotransferase/(S)-3-amino-2-methylpropionate transaminase